MPRIAAIEPFRQSGTQERLRYMATGVDNRPGGETFTKEDQGLVQQTRAQSKSLFREKASPLFLLECIRAIHLTLRVFSGRSVRPGELCQSRAWASSIRTTSGQFARYPYIHDRSLHRFYLPHPERRRSDNQSPCRKSSVGYQKTNSPMIDQD
jgi:hypothetical protein